MDSRYPRPIYIQCDHQGSQARFLLAVLDPARDGTVPTGIFSNKKMISHRIAAGHWIARTGGCGLHALGGRVSWRLHGAPQAQGGRL